MQELPITETTSSCGCEEEHGLPELDARTIPHKIRHGAVIGAFSQVRPGAAMVLLAPHDPKPLLGQLSQIEGEAIEISYLEQGPEVWRLRLGRK